MNRRWKLGMLGMLGLLAGGCVAEPQDVDTKAPLAKGGLGDVCTVQGPPIDTWDGSPPPSPDVNDVTVAVQTSPGLWLVAMVDTKDVAIPWWVTVDSWDIGPLIGVLGTRELLIVPMGPPPPPPVWDAYVSDLAIRTRQAQYQAIEDIGMCQP